MPTHDLHILITEDDSFQRNIIVELLHALGICNISEAANGHEALKIIANDDLPKVDLVFCDLKMPEMDGMEFLRSVAEAQYDIEMVILSAMDKKLLSTANKLSNSYKIKLLGILEKPITMQKLRDALSKSGQIKQEVKPKTSATALDFTIDEILQGLRLKQFIPYLQPKVDLKTGRIVGVEALARWIHPKHGVVAPYAFISKLEEHGRIDDLTFLMLEETALICKTLSEKENHNIHIAVNLSLLSLNDPKISRKITSIVTENGGDPQHFTLEITESIAMTDTPVALENLARLSMNGFTLSIDDYGTGYSNMHQLTHIDFGELKIDRSLVHGCATNQAMKIVIASNIEMAHNLGIKCVAEGIEDEQDWKMLQKMGCDIGQGYHIAKPMNVIDFYNFIEDYHLEPLKTAPKNIQHFIQSTTKVNVEKKILVIEDDKATRNTIVKILINLGYQKTVAVENAQEAIDLFETQQFDLIFTDIFMPNMNGLDLIKRIRTNKTLAKPNTRIVILSGITESKVLGVALALNVNDVLVKPLIPDVVDEKIKRIMKNPCHTQNPIAYEAIDTNTQELVSHSS